VRDASIGFGILSSEDPTRTATGIASSVGFIMTPTAHYYHALSQLLAALLHPRLG
jgi:hypothetical protein